MAICQKCFLQELHSFRSIEAETQFITLLNRLVEDNVIEKLEVKQTNLTNSLYTQVDNYRCKYCKEEWSYSTSERAWRGFFIKTKNIERRELLDKRKETNLKLGCLLFLIAILAIIYYFA